MTRPLGWLVISLCLIMFAAPAAAQRGDAPCPDPDELASTVPSNMSTVQGDIDRLTLCVERANLINQLNELVIQREEMLNPPAPDNANTGSFDRRSNQPARLQQIRRDQLNDIPRLDQSVLNDTSVRANQDEDINPRPPMENPQWFVVDIQGSAGNLIARVESENGNTMTVSSGDQLPTGQTVADVSVINGVSVTDESGQTNLPWADNQG